MLQIFTMLFVCGNVIVVLHLPNQIHLKEVAALSKGITGIDTVM